MDAESDTDVQAARGTGNPPAGRSDEPSELSRRRLLEAICGLAGLAAALISETACAPDPPREPAAVTIPLRRLEAGRRVTVIVAGNPVEVVQGPGGVVARSLRCTHWGCVVKWRERERVYVCPCHEGRYNEDGSVLEGPPPAALRTIPARISGLSVTVGS